MFIASVASLTTPLSRTRTNTVPRATPGRLSLHCRSRVVGSAVQPTAPISICLVAKTKTSTPQPHFGGTTRSATPTTLACHPIPSLHTSMPVLTSTPRSIALRAALSVPIFTSRFTTLPQIRGRWLRTTRSPTIALWQWLSVTTFMRAVATLHLTRPGATIQAPIRGMTLQSPICLRAAPLPRPAPTTVGGYLPAATSTSPSAPARLPGIRLRTPGATCQAWYKPATTSQAQPPANPFTPLPAALRPALVPTTTSSTPKFFASHRHQRRLLLRGQQQLLRRLRQQRLQLHPLQPRRRLQLLVPRLRQHPLRQQHQLLCLALHLRQRRLPRPG